MVTKVAQLIFYSELPLAAAAPTSPLPPQSSLCKTIQEGVMRVKIADGARGLSFPGEWKKIRAIFEGGGRA